eukprot:TRINITY_DN63849_c0_g1_i1.p1 TRINITY_DN63849_c0_g1~~TRINITY_DN63849_c0_g1_i1.p1  ORF type:complete len:122 (-),score=9.72 TRINITY_DN63849_c0_g1_i1:2-367(-)
MNATSHKRAAPSCRESYADGSLYPVEALPHHDAVAPDHHHPDLVLFSGIYDLDSVVQHNVHELIVPAQNADNVSVRRQFQVQPLLHELPQISTSSSLGSHCSATAAAPCESQGKMQKRAKT